MTNRARWLLFIALVGLFGGILRGQEILTLVSLSVFGWVLVEWFRFQARVHFELPQLEFERRVNGSSDINGTLWVGRTAHIELRVSSATSIQPVIQIRDIVPEILELQEPQTAATASRLNGRNTDEGSVIQSLQAWILRRFPSYVTAPLPPNNWTLDREISWSSPEVNRTMDAGNWLRKTLRFPVNASPINPPLKNPATQPDTPKNSETFSYTVGVRAAGQVTLPGVRLTLQDRYGFFRMHRFVAVEQKFRLLPDYFQSAELRPTVKRQNSLPQHGIHRLQRSGTGAELLELREYVPGDPPKSIAWKVSARRDKLMTRKYESEVPVRVHLFIDGSFSTRIGGYGLRLIDQLNFVAASVAKAAISVGDPVSAMLVDEYANRRLPWVAGDRGFMQLLKALAEFSQTAPPASLMMTHYLMQCALRVSHERFPELLERSYNPIPFSFFASTRERYRMAGVIAEVFELSPKERVECLHDNSKLAYFLHLFLYHAGMPWMAPMIVAPPDPAAGGQQRMHILGNAMAKAIAHARDNEVFVVLADLVSCAPNLSQLLRVVKLALAKHHRVAFVCPTSTFIRPGTEIIVPKSSSIHDLMLAAEQARVRDLTIQMKRDLVRLGVAVSFAGEQSAIQMIIAEMGMARDGRTLAHGVRS
jgi:uncharacterized protein (DUF58 family)